MNSRLSHANSVSILKAASVGWVNQRSGRQIVVIPLLLLLGACDQVRRILPERAPEPEAARYELQRDAQGRVIRLNKVTGEVVIVSGNRLIPVNPSTGDRSNSGAPRRLSAAAPTPSVAADTPQLGPAVPAPETAVTSTSAVIPAVAPVTSPASGQIRIGSKATVVSPSPLFLYPDQTRTPLLIMEKGTVVTLLGSEGEWYRVQFDDPRFGRRVGFVGKGAVVDFRQLEPMDLSIRDPKLKELEPMDLSIRDPKLKELEPVDLSIPKPQ